MSFLPLLAQNYDKISKKVLENQSTILTSTKIRMSDNHKSPKSPLALDLSVVW